MTDTYTRVKSSLLVLLRDTDQKVIALKGKWGTGKTYLWRAVATEMVFFDALRVKIRQDGVVRNKAVYLALGMLADGTRDILGIWIENTEGAKFWMKVFNDMKTRGFLLDAPEATNVIRFKAA